MTSVDDFLILAQKYNNVAEACAYVMALWDQGIISGSNKGAIYERWVERERGLEESRQKRTMARLRDFFQPYEIYHARRHPNVLSEYNLEKFVYRWRN